MRFSQSAYRFASPGIRDLILSESIDSEILRIDALRDYARSVDELAEIRQRPTARPESSTAMVLETVNPLECPTHFV